MHTEGINSRLKHFGMKSIQDKQKSKGTFCKVNILGWGWNYVKVCSFELNVYTDVLPTVDSRGGYSYNVVK